MSPFHRDLRLDRTNGDTPDRYPNRDMATWQSDPSFYPAPRHAMQAPPETLAYVALRNAARTGPDAIGVVDVDPRSSSYGQWIHELPMREPGDGLRCIGWNADSASLCPYGPRIHAERRYLIVPGQASTRIHIVDTKPDPALPELAGVIEPEIVTARTGYATLRSVHSGPDGIYVNALDSMSGERGGVFLLDSETFELKGRWERECEPRIPAHDFWWHLGFDTMVTFEPAISDPLSGAIPWEPAATRRDPRLHFWSLRSRRHRQSIDLGPEIPLVCGIRPAHSPTRPFGFLGVVVSPRDLSSSIWIWIRDPRSGYGKPRWTLRKVLTIPALQAAEEDLPSPLKPFRALPPLVTDLNLSLDDRFLYVSCWGTGELRQYDVTNPLRPRLTGRLTVGGSHRTPHPAAPHRPLRGGPHTVQLSRDGRRIYLTNGLDSGWSRRLLPEASPSWLVKVDVDPSGGIAFDPRFFVAFDRELLPQQVRLQGGDASSDSFCFS